jgi:hypothetical protein
VARRGALCGRKESSFYEDYAEPIALIERDNSATVALAATLGVFMRILSDDGVGAVQCLKR